MQKKEKGGLSTIIVTLILILVSIVAVGIVWLVVRNIIQTGTEGVGLSQFSLSAKILDVAVDNSSNNVSLSVKRNAGKGELEGISFVFSSNENTEVITKNVSLKELEQMTFKFHLSMNVSDLISVSIVPLVRQDEKEIVGIALDKYNLGKNKNTQSGQTVCSPASNPCGTFICGSVANGTCGQISCGTCGTGYSCNASGRCVSTGNYTYALSCSQIDVQNAINSASNGDTIIIPAGTCTWSSGIAINSKSLKIKGNGMGRTNITYTDSGSTWGRSPFWLEYCADNFEISGITFRRNNLDGGLTFGFIFLTGSCKNWRIHDNEFWTDGINSVRMISISSGSAIIQPYGLIDNNIFTGASTSGSHQGVLVSGTVGISWNQSMDFGSSNAVYIENNNFNFDDTADGVIDCSNGGRVVFRNNNVGNSVAGNHGYDSADSSCLKMEIYNNTFKCNQVRCNWAVQFRGGTGVVFNNVIEGNYNKPIAVTNYRSCSDTAILEEKSWCNGTSTEDKNTLPLSTYYGWACYQQIGRGTNQSLYPLYEWNNCKLQGCSPGDSNDIDINVYVTGTGACYTVTHIQVSRDYYSDTMMAGYTPYTYPHPLTLN